MPFSVDIVGKYQSGQYGYSDAKTDLKELFFDCFRPARERYRQIQDGEMEVILQAGGKKAREQVARLVFELRSEMATRL
jgi:tryptophanyl-tRNA synthetase